MLHEGCKENILLVTCQKKRYSMHSHAEDDLGQALACTCNPSWNAHRSKSAYKEYAKSSTRCITCLGNLVQEASVYIDILYASLENDIA